MIAALLTAVVIAAFYVTYGVIDGWSIFAILLVIIVVAIVTPFGIMLGRLVSRCLGFKPRDLGEGELIAPMELTYHATPKHHWQASGADESYLSTDFADEGFIHCTDSIDALPSVLTTYYRDEPGDWVVLTIDGSRVSSPLRYEDPDNVFPHIYGPLNRDAIIDVRDIARDEDGTFLALPGA